MSRDREKRINEKGKGERVEWGEKEKGRKGRRGEE